MSIAAAEPFWEPARARLDALLELEIRRLRARYQLSLDEQRGLYVSDAQVDRLLGLSVAAPDDDGAEAVLAATDRWAGVADAALGKSPHWGHVVREFALGPFERDVLVLCLAPEADRRYSPIYAYLNDDVGRRFATRELALRLFAARAARETDARALLAVESTLLSAGLIRLIGGEHDARSWLESGLTVPDIVAHFLLGSAALGGPRPPGLTTHRPTLSWDDAALPDAVARVVRRVPIMRGRTLLVLEGRAGSGRRRAAAGLASQGGVPLITIDTGFTRPGAGALFELVRTALLQQRLHRAVLHLRGDEWLAELEPAAVAETRRIVSALGTARGTVLVSVAPETRWREPLAAVRHASITFAEPSVFERRRVWSALRGGGSEIGDESLTRLASRYSLTPGQIARASAAADDRWTLDGRNGTGPDGDTLLEAARAESRGGLATLGPLASRTATGLRWEDLVFPQTTVRELRELADAIRNRETVYDSWGLASRNSNARGIRALFSGPSGTGKTTSAAIIATIELGVDLYTVDLAAVSSKYIGETEKHLDRIFAAARASSAILFFDEADALFGKRSEVKDAHDRYSNIEVAYLLQKVDQHDGTIVLATNLANNLDLGFSRRMHYVIEFPFPTEAERERIWQTIYPAATPVEDDVDFGFLARQFSIAGGDIRNVALAAAFLAAAGGRPVAMRDLVRAMGRQMMKQGRSPSIVDFREYMPLLQNDP